MGDSYFEIDTLLQGFVAVFFIILGCTIFFTDQLENSISKRAKKDLKLKDDSVREEQGSSEDHETFTSMNKKIGETVLGVFSIIAGLKGVGKTNSPTDFLKISSSILYVLTIAILIFVLGVFAKPTAEKWMSQDNISHLGNKIIWVPTPDVNDSISSLTKTDDFIRIRSFDHIFKDDFHIDTLTTEEKNRYYYFAKHELLYNKQLESNTHYRSEITNIIKTTEFAEVFAFSFFILYIFCWLNLISIQIRSIMDKDRSIIIQHTVTFRIVKAIYRLALLCCFLVILMGITNYLDIEGYIFPIPSKKIYVLALNIIPIITWVYLWARSRQKYENANLIHSPNITYRDLFMKHYFTIIFLFIGFFGYVTAAVTWRESAQDRHSMICGMYKNANENFNRKIKNEFKEMIGMDESDSLKLEINNLTTELSELKKGK